MLEDLHAREELIEVGGDHVLERHEAAVLRERQEPLEQRRHLDPREVRCARRPGRAARTARFSERLQMYGNGRPESTASGVRTGKIFSLNISFSSSRCAGVELVPPLDPHAGARRAPASRPRRTCARALGQRDDLGRDRGQLLAAASGRRRTACATPASTCCFRPATRTWKNSSRLLAKIARNLARSSSGSDLVLGQRQHARVEVDPRQLPVQEPVLGCGGCVAPASVPERHSFARSLRACYVGRCALGARPTTALYGYGRTIRGARRPGPPLGQIYQRSPDLRKGGSPPHSSVRRPPSARPQPALSRRSRLDSSSGVPHCQQ